MAWVEVYGGQRSLAFELNTAILWLEIQKKKKKVRKANCSGVEGPSCSKLTDQAFLFL